MMQEISPVQAGDNRYVINPGKGSGRLAPVHIYANDALLRKMLTDRTIRQACNVASIPGIVGHGVVLPDGHEG